MTKEEVFVYVDLTEVVFGGLMEPVGVSGSGKGKRTRSFKRAQEVP